MPSCLKEYSLFLLSVLIERLQVTGFYLDFKSNGKFGWSIMFAGNHQHVTAVYLHNEQMTRRRQLFRHKYRYTRWSGPFIPPEDNSYTINGVFDEVPLAPGQYMLLVVSLSQGLVNYTSFYYDGKCLHSSEHVIHSCPSIIIHEQACVKQASIVLIFSTKPNHCELIKFHATIQPETGSIASAFCVVNQLTILCFNSWTNWTCSPISFTRIDAWEIYTGRFTANFSWTSRLGWPSNR